MEKEKLIKTVQDLIDELMAIEDKTLPIFGYIIDNEKTYDCVVIELVDDDITLDRVDINFNITEK